jgi:serine/threonine protein phosphatase PrpC
MDNHFFGLTDTGKTRDNNEDSFIVQTVGNEQFILAAVIDGVGGYNGGEVAAAIAKQEISQQLATRPADPIAGMTMALKKANTAILAKKQAAQELSEMACVATLVLADIENNQFFFAHIGDTRLYLLRDGSLVKISKDHSFVGFLEDSGRLDESAAMQHPKRNEINKAIGFSEEMVNDESYIETGQSPFLPGDLLLLCSDGLTDMVNRQDITSLLAQGGTLASKAKNLIDLANENGGLDNITAVLVKNNKAPLAVQPTRPSQIQQVPASQSASQPKETPAAVLPKPEAVQAPKRHYGLILLAILCLVLLASTVFLFIQHQHSQNTSSAVATPAKKPARNSQELLLQDAFDNAVNHTVVLSDSIFKSPIIINDTLRIRKDTLYVFAKGIVLQAGPNYKGAAIKIMSPATVVKLDSLAFQGFDTALAASNQALSLKNVTFTNCVLPIQNGYLFPNQQLVNVNLPIINTVKNANPQTVKPKNGTK